MPKHVLKGLLAASCLILFAGCEQQPPVDLTPGASELLTQQPGAFVPNQGQWSHDARFVHRSGPMTVFLEDRGWVVDLSAAGTPSGMASDAAKKVRAAALRMRFEGHASTPTLVGERPRRAQHNYLVGDRSRWRTGVPVYGSVLYRDLYPGIDLRMREQDGVPEYDLLLQPGADLASVAVHVEGGRGLTIAADGSLVLATDLGPLTQKQPKTWAVDAQGEKHAVRCSFTKLGDDRFGFVAPEWDGEQSLTIDPGLVWSSVLGGSGNDFTATTSVDPKGIVTVGGFTRSANFPKTTGAYSTTYPGNEVAFVSRLDPKQAGAAQLIYSTYLGGSGRGTRVMDHHVDANGVVTVTGGTLTNTFPTTTGAFDTTHNGGNDVFVSRLDPRKTGAAQLVYSTFVGGRSWEAAQGLAVSPTGVVTVCGLSGSPGYPTTSGAFDTTYNGGMSDAFVTRLDPSKTGTAQLTYSTFLGADNQDGANAIAVDAGGVVIIAGVTFKGLLASFPVTSGAFDKTHNGGTNSHPADGFLCRLDPSKSGSAQLLYSTFLGGSGEEEILDLALASNGQATVTGWTGSKDFPTSSNAFDRTFNGGVQSPGGDVFVSRLIPLNIGGASLLYSTYVGAAADDFGESVAVDDQGVITVACSTRSTGFPVTSGAFDTTYNGGVDGAVCRLDSRETGTAQLLYSTFLGGKGDDRANAIAIYPDGTALAAGSTSSTIFPTTPGAFNRTANGASDVSITRLDMGMTMHADLFELSRSKGGAQTLTVDAGRAHANRSYQVFGSATGTTPGINLLGLQIPLNPDAYTQLAMGNVNTTVFTRFRGTLDAAGRATAVLNVPGNLPSGSITLHHAVIVFGAGGRFYLASNPVPLTIR